MSKTFDSDANGPGSKHKVETKSGRMRAIETAPAIAGKNHIDAYTSKRIVLAERMAALFVPTGAVGLDDSAVVRDFGQGEKATRQMQPGCRRG